ncbi:hypothetical protein HDG37_002790 [Paraburkholderia sp. MM5384-R2]|nr:hypothetical protein [Paraburkholderia sp. MM5384-R2]
MLARCQRIMQIGGARQGRQWDSIRCGTGDLAGSKRPSKTDRLEHWRALFEAKTTRAAGAMRGRCWREKNPRSRRGLSGMCLLDLGDALCRVVLDEASSG